MWFLEGQGCADQLFSLRMLMEWVREFINQALFLCFVDLKKAYDSVNHDALWTVLQERCHLPPKQLQYAYCKHYTKEPKEL